MTTYELTSRKAKGALVVSYDDNGRLKSFEMNFKQPLTSGLFAYLVSQLPYEQQYINNLTTIGFEISETLKDNQKIALFCRLYEQYVGIKYKVSAADSGKIKKLNVNEDLLKHYFTSTRFEFKAKQSIANMAKYWNELLRDYAGANKAADFPNHWDAAFAAKLDGPKLSKYWAYLRQLGLKPKKDRNGNITNWIK